MVQSKKMVLLFNKGVCVKKAQLTICCCHVQIFGVVQTKYLVFGKFKYLVKPGPNIWRYRVQIFGPNNWSSDQCNVQWKSLPDVPSSQIIIVPNMIVVSSSCQTTCFSNADNVSVIKGLSCK